MSEDEFLVGCVGNFRSMKRQDLVIGAFARLLPVHPGLRLVLVGDGELRPEIERQVRDLGLGDRVIVFGTATDLPPLYDSFDLFVQASNSEGLPNVLLEASSAGLPIVATAAGGTGGSSATARRGCSSPSTTWRAWHAMHRAIADASLRRRLGSAARSVIEREYGMDRFCREYAGLYRELLAAKRG